MVLFLIEHKRGNGPTSVGAGPSLSMNMDGGTANAEVIDGSWDSVGRGRH